MKIKEQLLGDTHLDLAITNFNTAEAYRLYEDFSKAKNFYQKSLNIMLANNRDKYNDTAIVYNRLGYSCHILNELDLAIEYFLNSIDIWLKAEKPNLASVGNTYNDLAFSYEMKGDNEKAIESYKKALRCRPDNPIVQLSQTAQAYNNVGLAYFDLGNTDVAIAYVEEAVKIARQDKDEKSLKVYESNLGFLKFEKENPTPRDNVEKTVKNEDSSEIHSTTFGFIEAILEKFAQEENAEKTEKNELQASEEKLLENAWYYIETAMEYEKTWESVKALEYYEKALKIQLEVTGKYNNDVATTYYHISKINHKLGSLNEAIQYAKEALKIVTVTNNTNAILQLEEYLDDLNFELGMQLNQ